MSDKNYLHIMFELNLFNEWIILLSVDYFDHIIALI